MRHYDPRAIERWLGAGAPDAFIPELEDAWTGLLAELPDEAPSPDFAARVMQRLAGVRVAVRDLAPRWRLALAACLALLALSALALPALLTPLPIPVGGLIAALAGAVKAGAGYVTQSVSVWRFLTSVAQILSVVVATPQAIALLASFALLSGGALGALFELTRPDRRTADAATH
jgi:hypothetical protein